MTDPCSIILWARFGLISFFPLHCDMKFIFWDTRFNIFAHMHGLCACVCVCPRACCACAACGIHTSCPAGTIDGGAFQVSHNQCYHVTKCSFSQSAGRRRMASCWHTVDSGNQCSALCLVPHIAAWSLPAPHPSSPGRPFREGISATESGTAGAGGCAGARIIRWGTLCKLVGVKLNCLPCCHGNGIEIYLPPERGSRTSRPRVEWTAALSWILILAVS